MVAERVLESLAVAFDCRVTSTNVTARVTINNMAGTGPPFKTYIRIGEGPYINRVVLGIPDINAGWANTTSTVGGVTTQTYTLITSWTEKDFFPRIPGWTLEEVSLLGCSLQLPRGLIFSLLLPRSCFVSYWARFCHVHALHSCLCLVLTPLGLLLPTRFACRSSSSWTQMLMPSSARSTRYNTRRVPTVATSLSSLPPLKRLQHAKLPLIPVVPGCFW